MTSLAIIPNYEKKRLKLVGTVAAGEHIETTVMGAAEWTQAAGAALRLRVLFGGKCVAKFPYWEEEHEVDGVVVPADAWRTDEEGNAVCELILNTIPAEKCLRFGGDCLWVLDDAVNHTLYGAGEFNVGAWPKRCGEDTPYNLDEYPDLVREFGERLDIAETAINTAVDETIPAAIAAMETETAKIPGLVEDEVEEQLSGKVDKPSIIAAGNFAQFVTGGNIEDSGKSADDFADARQVANAINTLNNVKANTVDLNAEITRAQTKENVLSGMIADETTARTIADQNLTTNVNEVNGRVDKVFGIAQTHEAALGQVEDDLQRLDRTKADLVNGKVPSSQLPDMGGKFIVVAILPDAASADAKAIYLVPRTDGETGNIYDEYVVVEPTAGAKTWERIGSTDIDLEPYATIEYVNSLVNYSEMAISAFTVSPANVEKGSTVTSATLSYTMNKTPESATLDGDTVTVSARTGTIDLTGLSLTNNKTWTLAATEAAVPGKTQKTATKTATLSFLWKRYFGAAAQPDNIETATDEELDNFLLGGDGVQVYLPQKELAANKKTTFSANAGVGFYIWYAVPASFGACTFKVGGFEGGFTLVKTFNHTNASKAVPEPYNIYRSDNANLGNTEVTVS